MGQDSIIISAAAAARNGYTSIGMVPDSRYKLTSGAVTVATIPTPMVITEVMLKGAAAVKGKLVAGSDPAHLIEVITARTLAAASDLSDAKVPMRYPLVAQETLTAFVDNGNNSEIDNMVIKLDRPDAQGASPGSYGKIWALRGTSTTASVAHTWVAKSVTWGNTLANPKGKYHILGASHSGATAVAMRIYSNDNPNLRPTIVSATSAITASVTMYPPGSVVELQGDQLSALVVEVCSQSTDNADEYMLIVGEL